jgi:hypothetical protein
MNLVFDIPEFLQAGNKLPELALKFLKYSWLKLLVVVRHLSFGVTQ